MMPAARRRATPSRGSHPAPAVTEFRGRVGAILAREASASRSRHVVILALDGIPYRLARRRWPHASTARMRSVFPPTSSTAWLSSLTGLSVAAHGIPGVFFRLPEHGGALIDVFAYKGRLITPATENIFSDAAALGYAPLSILGDLAGLDCSWRDLLLRHSRQLNGERFFTGVGEAAAPRAPETVCRQLRDAVLRCLAAHAPGSPCLVWCFIDVDTYVHRHGYDQHVAHFLSAIDQTAGDLMQANAVVLAHSDHGLVRTNHDPRLARLIERLRAVHRFSLGGAGRCRWIYPRPGSSAAILAELEHHLPPRIRLAPAEDLFPAGSLARTRVGDILLIAEGEDFLTLPGYSFEHGSLTTGEVDVPFAEWRP
jgi:hypothetical protein